MSKSGRTFAAFLLVLVLVIAGALLVRQTAATPAPAATPAHATAPAAPGRVGEIICMAHFGETTATPAPGYMPAGYVNGTALYTRVIDTTTIDGADGTAYGVLSSLGYVQAPIDVCQTTWGASSAPSGHIGALAVFRSASSPDWRRGYRTGYRAGYNRRHHITTHRRAYHRRIYRRRVTHRRPRSASYRTGYRVGYAAGYAAGYRA